MNYFKKIKAFLHYYKAVNAAEKAHAQDGDVYFVLPGINGKTLITNKRYFKLLKKRGYISKNRNMKDVQLGCFYRTAGLHQDSMSDEEITFRKHKYYHWYLKTL